MEKSKHTNLEIEPLVANYDELLNIVYLGLACENNLPGSLEASDIHELLEVNYPNMTERQNIVRKLGIDFDRGIVNLIATSMIFRKKSMIVEAPPRAGICGSDYFPWEEKLKERMDTLKETGAIKKDCFFKIRQKEIEGDILPSPYFPELETVVAA